MKRPGLAALALALAASYGTAAAPQDQRSDERGGRGGGKVTIAKTIINRTAMPTPRMAFQVRMDCWPTGSASIVILVAPAGLVKSVEARPRSRCTITELPPLPPPGPCWWLTSYPDGREAAPGRTLRVINELRCEGMGSPRGRRPADGGDRRGW